MLVKSIGLSFLAFVSTAAAAAIDSIAPLLPASSYSEVIPNSYIVVLKETVSDKDFYRHKSLIGSFLEANFNPNLKGHGIKIEFDISPEIRGYTGVFSKEDLETIRSSPEIAYIEKDIIVYTNDDQFNAPWGLARISHAEIPDPETDDSTTYTYQEDAGEGVTAYIVDTGINISHEDFEGRAVWGKTIPQGDRDEDGNGHGSHVAGTVGGKTYGVAKKAKLVAVKVLRSNGSGTMSDVIGGIDYVTKKHREEDSELKKVGKRARSVANMSLGGGKTSALDAAVNAAVNAGVHFAVAAGNENQDACNSSPAAAAKPITVGATNKEDARAWFSNWGKCVDIFAPGQDILSIWIGSNVATNIISGTSMASPHVCGALAALLSRPEHEDASPAILKARMIATAKKDILSDIPAGTKTPNRMLYVNPKSKSDE